jgi:hypothetical protein
MAIGDRTAKKLSQAVLTSTIAAQVTCAASTRTQVTSMRFANTGASIRYITVRAHGNATANTVIQRLQLDPYASAVDDNPIVLNAGEIVYALQDTGTDVVMTVYGIEEALS